MEPRAPSILASTFATGQYASLVEAAAPLASAKQSATAAARRLTYPRMSDFPVSRLLARERLRFRELPAKGLGGHPGAKRSCTHPSMPRIGTRPVARPQARDH